MLKNSINWYFLFLLLFSFLPIFIKSVDDSFCYEENNLICGPSTWPGICQTGVFQSPVELDPNRAIIRVLPPGVKFYHRNSLDFPSFRIRNTGKTIQITVNPSPYLKGEYLGLTGLNYRLSHMEFHWGSRGRAEHVIKNRSYPIEFQLYHYQSEPDFSDINYPQPLANEPQIVLSILFKISTESNLGLEPIIEALSTVSKTPNKTITIQSQLNLTDILFFNTNTGVDHRKDFFRYKGSLTRPDCDENVIWFVFRYPMDISMRQFESFRNILNKDLEPILSNSRPRVKFLDLERTVELYVVPFNVLDWIIKLILYTLKYIIFYGIYDELKDYI